jgi:hypothetical protein
MNVDELRARIQGESTRPEPKRYCVIACHVLWRELCHYAAQSENVFCFRFLEQGLHNTPDKLRSELQKMIDEEDGKHDALLIGYGLCSNGIQGVVARTTPLVCVRAHDCITFLLGSKERYREYFDSHPGTYWYSPGWIEDSMMPSQDRYAASLKTFIEIYGEENAEYLMDASETWIKNYGMATYVDLDIGGSETYRRYTRECAEWLGWEADFPKGDPSLIQALLGGAWEGDAFLVVQPGEEVVASYEESVITSRPVQAD